MEGLRTTRIAVPWISTVTLAAMLCFPSPLPASDASGSAKKPSASDLAFFESRIRPILVERCYSCHSVASGKHKGGLFVDTASGLREGGSGGPAIVPGDPGASALYQAIVPREGEPEMPPKKELWLSTQQIKDIETWIKMGAPDPREGETTQAKAEPPIDLEAARKFWAFTPVAPVEPPHVSSPWNKHPVDAFLEAARKSKGLSTVALADRRTLIRRATFDLIGLPPTPAEVRAFENDHSPRAFENLVERLLASPHYGERWGRHWLDVARYADTAGDNADFPIPQAYLYRNYVVDAFNRDKPYDQFVREQIAGDLLPATTEAQEREQLIATGFVAVSRRYQDDILKYTHLTIEDTIDTMGKSMLGLTLSCARCHNHKFDPISSADYYGLYGIFASSKYPHPGCEVQQHQEGFVPLIDKAKAELALEPYWQKRKEMEAEQKRLRGISRKLTGQIEEEKKRIGGEIPDVKDCDEPNEQTLDKCKRIQKITELRKAYAAADNVAFRFGKKLSYFVVAGRPEIPTAYAIVDGKPQDARIHIKGNPLFSGAQVRRGFPAILGGQQVPAEETGSGRRQLADWIADPKNPLTARVMVNRIWQHHFGRGIVRTSENFGQLGERPSHPELLDYLARRFVQGGWSVKAMHRLIMTSRSYRLGSDFADGEEGKDPESVYLWRYPRRRLDAESIRDALLAMSGELDKSPGGPHPFPEETRWSYGPGDAAFRAQYPTRKRSIYLLAGRIEPDPLLDVFDGVDTNYSTSRRANTTTALQALALMNNPFIREQAERFANRVVYSRPNDVSRIDYAYRLVFGRSPSRDEQAMGRDYLARFSEKSRARQGLSDRDMIFDREAWTSYARALLTSNEFLYLD